MEKATWERGGKYASSLKWELNQNHPYVYFFLKKKNTPIGSVRAISRVLVLIIV